MHSISKFIRQLDEKTMGYSFYKFTDEIIPIRIENNIEENPKPICLLDMLRSAILLDRNAIGIYVCYIMLSNF